MTCTSPSKRGWGWWLQKKELLTPGVLLALNCVLRQVTTLTMPPLTPPDE